MNFGKIGSKRLFSGYWHLPYDAEVEYLEANPVGPFLVLPPVPGHCALDFKIKIYLISGSVAAFGGCKTQSSSSVLQFVFAYGILDYPTFYGYRRVSFTAPANRVWMELEVDGTSFIKDGTVIKSDFNNDFTIGWQTSGVGLFGTCNENHSYNSRAAARVAYFQYSADGKVVFDGTAVRFTNEKNQTEGAMYDRVSGELFRNQGTGAFIIGPDKVSSVQVGGV